MTTTSVLFALLALWLLTGIGCSYVMARRGHDAWSWGALGAVFGPLVVPLAIGASRREGHVAGTVRTVRVGRPGPGPVAVLVGVDGSPESGAAATGAVDLLGSRLGRLTLATVVDYDVAQAPPTSASATLVRDAEQILEEAASRITAAQPATVMLTGRPHEALIRFARDHGFDVVAVGARGHGISKAVLGSVAESLVRQHDMLVLVAGHEVSPIPSEP